MNPGYLTHLNQELEQLKQAGLYKTERVITSPQQPRMTANGREVICLCANNYLGLANHPEVIAAAKAAGSPITIKAYVRLQLGEVVAARTGQGTARVQ